MTGAGRAGPAARACALALAVAVPAGAQTLHGYAEAKGFVFAEKAVAADPDAIGWGTLFLEHERAVHGARLFGSLRLEGVTSDERGPVALDLADRARRRSPISLRELYVRVRPSSATTLELGRFQLGWGRTDGYSPADAFLPRDLSDPFSDERLPIWGGRLSGQWGRVRAEWVVAATTTPWRLPTLGGRYAPVDLDSVTLIDGAGAPPRAGFAAVRVQATRGDWDMGAWARAGERPAPLLVFRRDRARVAADGGVELPVDRRYVGEAGLGVEAARVVGAWVVRGEAAALFSDDAELGDAALVALGGERTFGDGRLLVTVAANLRDTPVDAPLLLDRALLPALFLVWNRDESWGRWRLLSTIGLEEGDGLVEAGVLHNLDDYWSVEVGADVPYGPRSGPLGALHAARRVRLGVRRAW